MLPSELVSKPIHEWSVDDLNLIVARQSEESQFLEFKERMPLKNQSVGWNFNGILHANERDGLAKEIVAFANAYGGHLVVGIKETQEKPSRAERLGDVNTDVAELAERLRSALNSIMDPPINGLRIQPIPSSEDGHGFLVIHVPQSIHAPHGFGKPPEAYVRRADRSEPMIMRDMQNVFWEARARRERIDAEIAASKDSFAKHAIRDRCVGYGFCAVSNDEIHISNIIQYLRMRSDERIPGLFGTDPIWSAAHSPENGLKWEPFSRGATQRFGHDMNSPHSRGSWSVDDHGVVSLYGDVSGAVGDSIAPSGPAESFRISPQDFVGALKQLLDLARLISFAGERPSTKWVIWGSVKASSSNFFVDKGRYETQKVDLTDAVDFRPVSIDLDNVSTWGDFLERRIWEFFNLHPAASLRYLAEAFVREWNWR